MAELDGQEWIKLLSQERSPSEEHLVFQARFRKILRIRKHEWNHYFSGWDGLGLRPGNEIELVAQAYGGPQITLPDWTIQQLELGTGDHVCITRWEDRYFLKKLALTERPSQIPGCTVIEVFDDRAVSRTYANRPDIEDIQLPRLQELLSRMGQLHHDPLAPFEAEGGRPGLLARKELLGGWTRADHETIRSLKQQLIDAQQADGSWESDVLKTAANLIRLLEIDSSPQEPAVDKAARWLLALPEPVGLPGLFLVSEKLAERFNQWKTKPDAKGRPHRREAKGELQSLIGTVGYLTNYALDACELRLTWTSALVLEALLRCGFLDQPRVLRALNTLLALSEHDGWCGCGYLDAKVQVPDSIKAVDFNHFPVTRQNAPHSVDWFPEPKDILQPVYDGVYRAVQAGERKALLIKSWHNTGLCTMVMHRALSYHPQYAGSALEAMGTLRLAYCQAADGTWGEMVYLSSMLGFLSRSTHPLAAFLVLRSVPLLIRTQRADGFWQEDPKTGIQAAVPPPTKKESTFLILKALQQFGYLVPLLPKEISMAADRARTA